MSTTPAPWTDPAAWQWLARSFAAQFIGEGLRYGVFALLLLQAVRALLDAVLDADNHFREFPSNAISRVLIIERYVALLDHLRQQGYTRVVRVAHSQRTVITADLLRYLQQRPRLQKGRQGGQATPAGQVDMEQLRQWLDGIDLRLLTMGCPLRQLCALRFPALYPWPVARLDDAQGRSWKDQALGADAHTHYLDLEQRDVAAELVPLVAG